MKYVSSILLLMAGLIIMVLAVASIVIGLGTTNQDTSNSLVQTTTVSPRSTPSLRPTTTPYQIPSDQDPIIGSWMNGMVFYANGSVGSDGKSSWRINENANNSYFVLSDMSTTEWIYNPTSDRINIRGSSDSIYRGIPKPTQKPLTTAPAIRTPTPAVTTTQGPKKFVYDDCVDACKMSYYADRHIGFYNDCMNTCAIENMKPAD